MTTFDVLEGYVALRRQVALIRASESSSLEFGHNQIGVLYRLSQGPATMGELAAYANTDKASMSRTVSLLRQSGLIRRLPDKKDRRVINIELTARGRVHAQKAKHIRDQVGKKLNMGLNASERKQFVTLVEKIVRCLQEHPSQ